MQTEELIKKLREIKSLGGSPKFYELLLQIADLHSRKNKNYAKDSDPLSNLRECEKIGVRPFLGVVIRLLDKWSRLTELAKGKPDVVGENIKDTLMDNAIYSLLAIVLLDEEKTT